MINWDMDLILRMMDGLAVSHVFVHADKVISSKSYTMFTRGKALLLSYLAVPTVVISTL